MSLRDAAAEPPKSLGCEDFASLTREDQEIVAHDRLNPGFGFQRVPAAMMVGDGTDFSRMVRIMILRRLATRSPDTREWKRFTDSAEQLLTARRYPRSASIER